MALADFLNYLRQAQGTLGARPSPQTFGAANPLLTQSMMAAGTPAQAAMPAAPGAGVAGLGTSRGVQGPGGVGPGGIGGRTASFGGAPTSMLAGTTNAPPTPGIQPRPVAPAPAPVPTMDMLFSETPFGGDNPFAAEGGDSGSGDSSDLGGAGDAGGADDSSDDSGDGDDGGGDGGGDE